ncbi:MAG: Tol-Pal system beta propeller repeat protein TolB [Paracoccus sp. (in: a-proteobacteria)]|nr:Tol-Pal system beta propeller repeat protein TolB [Paracoccus sp. (in: a-proteobacteria)]
MRRRGLIGGMACAALMPALGLRMAAAQTPLRIDITDGIGGAMPFAIAPFEARRGTDPGEAAELAVQIAELASADLNGSGLFERIEAEQPPTAFDGPVGFPEWRETGAELLITGSVAAADDQITLRFRLFDIFAGQPLGDGIEMQAPSAGWRRLAHKLADQALTRITGEAPWFDTRIAFVGEDGPPTARRKRIGVMDYDGQNVNWVTDGAHLVLGPRISPDGQTVLFTSYATGVPQVIAVDLATMTRRQLTANSQAMSFGPRISPNGEWIAFSRETQGNTDIWVMDRQGVFARQLTQGASIDTSPSWSPDGQRIVFESDRSGSPQLYVMRADGSGPTRISFGEGRYGTPAWSPRGDAVAFTHMVEGRARIATMRPDGSDERILTEGPGDEAPSWGPSGRNLVFARQQSGEPPAVYYVDVTGRNLRPVESGVAATEPFWGPLLS